MIAAAFYDRRKKSVSVGFGERRIIERRYQQWSYLPERRRFASQARQHKRETLPIAIHIRGKRKEVSGYVRDISPVGLQVLADAGLSTGTSIAVQFFFVDNKSYLCFPGQVIYCRPAKIGTSAMILMGIRFAATRRSDDEILISIIQDIRKRATTQQKAKVGIIVFDDFLTYPKKDIYKEIHANRDAKNTGMLESKNASECERLSDESDNFVDRRFASRITVHLSGNMEIKDSRSADVPCLPIEIFNLSAGGATITLDSLVHIPADVDLELCLFPTSEIVRASGRIVWNHSKIFGPSSNRHRFLYGIQFARLGDCAREQVGRFLSQRILSKEQINERRVKTTIVSELIRFKNRNGMNIVGFFDHLRDRDTSKNPFILIPPAYGETKKETLSFSWYLVKNGFNVIRYDNTEHVGESDGEIYSTTLTKMKLDLLSALDYVDTLGCKKIGVVAGSLSARSAIKAAAEDQRINFMICINPVVDLRSTLKAIYNYDIVEACLRDKEWMATNILGFEVNREFIDKAILDDFHNLKSTISDLQTIHIPVVFLAAKNDPWINIGDIDRAYKSTAAQRKDVFMIPEAMHRLNENPKLVKGVKKQVVRCCLKYLCQQEVTDIEEPNIREIVAQNRIERERRRNLKNQQSKKEKDFWRGYLSKFKYVVNVHHYWSLLGLIFDSLGKTKEGDIILDAGCGNGSFGAFLFVDTMYRNKDTLLQKPLPLFTYVGIDFVDSALKEAASVHENLQVEFIEKLDTRRLVSYNHILVDLNDPVNFKDNSFDKICCNLVISYLQNPLFTLRELARVLKPKGRLVITSLKPHADLTEIYRDFVRVAESDEEIEEAWKLLNNAGAIKCKEAEGHYSFFSEKDLTVMMSMAGFKRIKSRRVLANQASLVVGEKD